MRKLFKKLDNPFLLAAEGFIAGAILFLAANPESLQARDSRTVAQLESPAPTASQP